MDREELQSRITFRRTALTELRLAYVSLVTGQVQSYAIGSRNLTRFDITKLKDEITAMEKELDSMTAELSGSKRRKAVAVIPRN
jgi:hypothetical protein